MRTLLVIIVVGCVGSALAAEPPEPNPKEPVDYVKWLNDGFSKGVKDNAAPLYVEVAIALKDRDVLESLPKELTGDAPWTASERKVVEERVAANKALLDKFCAASRKTDCYFELKSQSDGLFGVVVPETAQLRGAARLLAARAWLGFLDGRVDAATGDLKCIFTAAQHLQTQPLLIQYLVGLSIEGTALNVLMNAAYAYPNACQRMVDGLKDTRLHPRTPVRGIAMEKLQALDAVQRWLKDSDGDGKYDTRTLPAVIEEPGPRTQAVPPRTLAETLAEVQDFYKRVQEAAGAEYPQAKPLFAAIAKERPAQEKNAILAIVGIDLDRTYSIYVRGLATGRGAWIVLRLQAYHAKTGKWPSELKEVLANDPPETPIDPFSMKPFVYRIEGDKPLLYSVSLNGVDDHGEVVRKDGKAAWDTTGDRVFLPALP